MRGVHTLASTQAHRARISPPCGGSALARPLAAVSLAGLSLSRFHLPVLLGSIPVTELLRYYEDSDAFRARLFAPLSGMNSASPPGSRSPLHLTPTSNHPVSNHLRALRPLSGCLCGGLPESCPPLPVGIRFSGFALRSWARRALKPNRVQLGSAYGLVVRFQLLPTRLSATQLLSATKAQLPLRSGLSPNCWSALVGALAPMSSSPTPSCRRWEHRRYKPSETCNCFR
jgi:hypothetical protein